ncbi:SWIM zinc finger family protein [Cytobacillus sp. S13-E01]|uniref:SWIM zinc finger family protein n=1 Tax=Cytobacillus sp. S13-E01 TaxID=3031326 RepID=UPI0023D7F7DD|nr:SWIM zinc finger family protein [Cytobacillus sp. S13-E01]MDF0727025.1 SWIM zinc finger family protein [Cytobacillus sp. S13-E01]
MLQNEVSKEQIMHFAEKLQAFIKNDIEEDRKVVKKGLQLYRQGSVYNVKSVDHEIVGRVQDVMPADVTLDMDILEMSTCSCSYGDFCRHQMAVFFSVYSSIGDGGVGQFLDRWKSGPLTKKPTLEDIPVIKARELKSYENTSYASWLSFFDKEFEQFVAGRSEGDYYFISSIYHRYFQALGKKAPKSKELKLLFSIQAALTSIEKIISLLPNLKLSSYQFDYTVKPYIHNLVDSVLNDAIDLQRISLSFAAEPILEDMQKHIRDGLLVNTLFQYERFHLYRTLWSSIFNRKKWVDQEQESILQDNKANGWSGGKALALAHNAFLQKNDQLAIDYLKMLDNPAIHYTFWWIGELSGESEWNRIKPWVEYANEHIEAYILGLHSYESRRHIARTFLNTISDYAENLDEVIYIETMKKLMPYSYLEFTTHLIEDENYRGWVELQMLVGYEIEEHDRYILKTIENSDRSVLLPLYHQAVSKALKQKNRPSYKRAIKYLRKLRSYYRKLKQEDTWDMYIEKLALKTKRLRAFQEELTIANFIKR